MPVWARTTLMGMLGLVVAAGLGFFALQLVSQPVGLSSEPLTAGDSLVPVATETKSNPKPKKKPKPKPTTTTPSNTNNSGSDDSIFEPAEEDRSGKGSDDSGGDDHGGDNDDD